MRYIVLLYSYIYLTCDSSTERGASFFGDGTELGPCRVPRARSCIRVSGKSGDFHITLPLLMYRQKYSAARGGYHRRFYPSFSRPFRSTRSVPTTVLSSRLGLFVAVMQARHDAVPFCMQSTRNVINNLQISLIREKRAFSAASMIVSSETIYASTDTALQMSFRELSRVFFKNV